MWGIVQETSDKAKYLLTFTVGYDQKDHIDRSVKKVIPDSVYVHVHLFDSGKC